MKFIILVGKDNTGKTKTLKGVIEELVKQGAKVEDKKQFYKFGSYIKDSPGLLVPPKKEITILLKFKGKLIGITTYGDTKSVLSSKIDEFVAVRCTHVICGSHPQGSSHDYINTIRKKNPQYQFVEIHKIGCSGDDTDLKYNKICNFSDSLTVDEIIKHI